MLGNNANDKKKTLLAQKEKLLQEIQYCESKIHEFSNKSSSVYFGADSSDSEDGFPTFLDVGPSISELKSQDRLLKTCLQATQELTNVTVLESEVQVLIKDPDIGSEKGVPEPGTGTWREVTAECRIDLVPFTILFYVHQSTGCFPASCYRGVRVTPVKRSQEVELADSLLHSLTTPSDVLETIRSYAMAYRSRRGTLARLADKYANTLFMLPREEGGFVLKCGSVMQMSWKLENKSSSLAPFQHKMNFEIEYMDESFLKIIKQSHRQLSDPSLQTDERTLILSKIISTCVEAQGLESDTESRQLEKTVLDDDDDFNVEVDKEIMAPPKSIPKRTKAKGKENNDGVRKSVKRSAEEANVSVKKARSLDVTDGNTVNDEILDINTLLDKNNENVIETSHGDHDKILSKNNIGKSDKKNNNEESQDNVKSAKNIEVNTESENVIETSHGDHDKILSKNNIGKSDKKKNNKESQDNVKSAKNIEVNTESENVIESKTKVLVNSKKLNNVNGAKTQTQTDVSNGKIQTENARDSKLKKNGNPNDNKVHSKTSKSKKTGNFETTNKNTNSDSNKKIASEINHEPANKKPSSSNIKKTNSINAKVNSNLKSKKMAKSNNATKANDNANGKQPLYSDTDNVKPVNAQKIVNTGNSTKASSSESAKTKKIDEKPIQKASSDHNNAKTSVNTAKTKKNGVIKSANAKINTKNGDSKSVTAKIVTNNGDSKFENTKVNTKNGDESTNAKTNPKNGDTKSANAKINTKNSDESTNAKTNPKNGDTKSANAKINTKNSDESTNAKTNPKNGDTKSANAKINTKNGEESTNAKINAKISDSESANAKIVNPKTGNVNRVNSDTATVQHIVNTEPNKLYKKNTNLPKEVTSKLTNASQDNTKMNKDIKSKMVIKNHRNSSGNVKKTLKPSIGKESKIPQKKLSPAYAAVLKQNPVRISPRMLTKFKSPSDSSCPSKLFKTVTNIPRLLKKPTSKLNK